MFDNMRRLLTSPHWMDIVDVHKALFVFQTPNGNTLSLIRPENNPLEALFAGAYLVVYKEEGSPIQLNVDQILP